MYRMQVIVRFCVFCVCSVYRLDEQEGNIWSKRDEVTRDWRKIHSEGLNDPYASPSTFGVIKSRRMRWAGHVTRMVERRDVYRVLVGKTEGKRPLGRPRHRWEDNIKMDLQEVGCEGMDWLRIGKVASSCECGNEPSGSIKCGEFPD
jgi:hypothetical protein